MVTAETSCPQILTEATAISSKFKEVLNLFAKCHRGYNSNVVSNQAVDDLGKCTQKYCVQCMATKHCANTYIILYPENDIAAFLTYYRQTFPHATVMPKMHILEHHVVPWMRRWNIGAGLMGEQGAESVHSHFHRLEATYCGIPNRLDRLTYIFREHILETSPPLTNLQPPIKKRKVSE